MTRELSGDTRIRLDRIIGLKEWRETLALDKHDPAKIGEARRWSDGKLHIKRAHGWETLPDSNDYDLKEYKPEKAQKDLKKGVTTQPEFDDFVERLFNGDFKNAPGTVHLPKMDKGLLKTLGLNENTQFIFKAKYPHISPMRKGSYGQDLSKEEYKSIPSVIRKAKTAYMDADKRNFFIAFRDSENPDNINKLVFNKTTTGNYLVTLGKVNEIDELTSRKILPVRGRS